jgi:hypothetical protein
VYSPNAQVDINRAAMFVHQLGFDFSRHREIEQRAVRDFCLNVYERPALGPREGIDATDHRESTPGVTRPAVILTPNSSRNLFDGPLYLPVRSVIASSRHRVIGPNCRERGRS